MTGPRWGAPGRNHPACQRVHCHPVIMRTRRARCRRSLLAAPAAALVLLAGSALAQPAGGVGGAGQAAVDPLDLTGRTFGGLRLPLGPVAGVVEFAASHAWVWVEQDGGVTTQRLLLEDGVVVTLGSTRLEAKRAVVWIERLGGEPGAASTHQVFVYFDGVGSLAADAGTSLRASRTWSE